MTSSDAKVKRVQPYPIPLYVHRDGKFVREEILKLSSTGAIARASGPLYSVSSQYSLNFTLPVLDFEITCLAKVMKTYDRAARGEVSVERLVEFRFMDLQTEQSKMIQNFLIRIGQARR